MTTITLQGKKSFQTKTLAIAMEFVTQYYASPDSTASDIVYVTDDGERRQAIVGYAHLGNVIAYVLA